MTAGEVVCVAQLIEPSSVLTSARLCCSFSLRSDLGLVRISDQAVLAVPAERLVPGLTSPAALSNSNEIAERLPNRDVNKTDAAGNLQRRYPLHRLLVMNASGSRQSHQCRQHDMRTDRWNHDVSRDSRPMADQLALMLCLCRHGGRSLISGTFIILQR